MRRAGAEDPSSVVTTPTVAHLTATEDGVDLGVMISASHNPMPDNGIKFFAHGGHKLADAVEYHVPLLAQANPLWQSAHSFYGLLYYDSLAPFARSCAVMMGMTCLFLGLALVRMRRMSHEHL